MTKVKLKDATKELATGAGAVLNDATRVRKSADTLMQSLRKLEVKFTKEEEERVAKEKREAQEKLLSSHSKAFTMPDDDEPQSAPVPSPAKAEPAAPKAEAKPAPKAEAAKPVEKPVEKKQEAPKEAPKPAAKPAAEAPKAQQPAKAQPVKAEAPKQEAPKQEAPKQEAPKAEAKPVEAPKAEAAKPAEPEKPAKPYIGQRMPQPVMPPVKPVGVMPQRPAVGQRMPQPARPAQGGAPRQQGPYGRPANPQGPYGRPANGAPGAPRPQGGYAPRPQGGAPRPGMGGPRPGMGGGRPMRPKAPELTPVMEKERVSNYDPNKKNYVRQHDPEHVTRNKRNAVKNTFNGYDDEVIRGGRRARAKKPSAQQMMAPIKIDHAYMGETITVRDLTERIGKPAGEILKKLLMLGNMANINTELDFDTASLICADWDITLEKKLDKTAEDHLEEEDFTDTEENLESRAPVVTIMGHVDHGKTSLLDYIRHSRVTAGEAGGITQHIGAYTVDVDGRSITFLDTPGHEAFTAMRARGAQATDIAVLVVAADDGVMPQTVEAIHHAQAAEVPIIVAINKMDKEGADPEHIKQELTKYDVVCEDWGGETIVVPVSAKTGAGVEELLEMILLQADVLQLRANPNRLGRGIIIEAKLDKARGPLATVLVQNGTLHVGDNVIAGMASGRVRAMINDRGERVESAGPSVPVEVMGFDDVPAAGDEMIAVGDDKLSRQVADERRQKLKASREASVAKMSMENLFASIEEGKQVTLNLIIKADVQGSVEAVKQALEKLSNDEVKVRVLHSGAGAITKDDVNLASAFNAIIIGFNIRPDASARAAAEKEKVDVRLYTVIYSAIEDMEKAMKGMLEPEYKEVLLGHAEVRDVFKITGAGTIAGCYVTDGKMQRNAQVRLLRDNVVMFTGKLSSLKHYKDDAKEMAAGFECGMSLEGYNEIKVGDVVECYIMEEIPRYGRRGGTPGVAASLREAPPPGPLPKSGWE